MFGMNLLLTPKDRLSCKWRAARNCEHPLLGDNLKSIHIKPSVATIMHNHEQFIGQAIENVLAQKVNFEIELHPERTTVEDQCSRLIANSNPMCAHFIIQRFADVQQHWLPSLAHELGKAVREVAGSESQPVLT